MKQGTGNTTASGQKHEPVVHSVNPKAVSEIGNAQFKSSETMHQGRGFTAPQPQGRTIHHGGSQGKHK